MTFQLPKPKNWQDFESICFELWRSIWGDRYAEKNGRQGQSQAGVDIFGHPTYSSGLHAVQCKGKDDNYDTDLTVDEINAECEKAKSFQTPVKDFIIATTRPRDSKLQKHCLDITSKKKYPFPVHVWSWDDIEPEIAAREDILKMHYNLLNDLIEPSTEYTVDINSTQDKIAAFLTRPNIQGLLSIDILQLIHSLLYELIDNAFLHGHAGYCKIIINDNVILLEDNGKRFNTSKLSEINGREGVAAMQLVKKEFQTGFAVNYKRENSLNITSLVFSKDILNKPLHDTIEITLDNSLGMGRDIARRKAENDFKTIPANKKRIVINVLNNLFGGGSFAVAYFGTICHLLKEGQTVVVYLPNKVTYYESLRTACNDFPIEFIMRH